MLTINTHGDIKRDSNITILYILKNIVQSTHVIYDFHFDSLSNYLYFDIDL